MPASLNSWVMRWRSWRRTRHWSARRVADVDHVAHTELVLDEHEHPAEEVLHEALRAEAEGDARDARAGDERPEVHTELAEDRRPGDHRDRDAHDAAQDQRDRLGP